MSRARTATLICLVILCTGCKRHKSDKTIADVSVPTTTRYPIVLAHGILAGPRIAPFAKVRGALNVDGHLAFETRTHPVGDVRQRAALLGEQVERILEKTGAEKVNLIAHSMGGLDVRWLATNGFADRIASITTVSTPHRGAKTADTARSVLGPTVLGLASDVAKTFNAHFFGMPKHADWQGMLQALSEDNANEFNATTPDAAGVYYQSFAGVARSDGIPADVDIEACQTMWPKTFAIQVAKSAHFALSASMTTAGASDGVVAVESAKWGEFRGCIPADHMDEIGFYGNGDEGTRFDHVQFYRLVAADLAQLGY